jgi:hypothetical protein
MVDSENVRFCLANVSRNERMALLVRDASLKASYTDSASQWWRLAKKIRQLEKERPHHKGSIADMVRDLYTTSVTQR